MSSGRGMKAVVMRIFENLFNEEVSGERERIIDPQVRTFYRSIHQICGHQVDFVDDDHATGKVYCRAEHEDRGRWVVMAICYFDEYERRDGRWQNALYVQTPTVDAH